MNNGFNKDAIGLDPTMVPIIDTLDDPKVVKTASNTPNKKKGKGKDILKKVIFTIVVLLLMIGVAFGVYYYLSLGTKKGSSGNKTAKVLNDITSYINEPLSTVITDYGNFENIEINKCTLNTENVDITKIGSYEYSVMCDGSRYSAKVTIIANPNLILTTKYVEAAVGETLTASDFVTSNKNYTYEFINEDAVINYLKSSGGPYNVAIRVKDEYGTEKEVHVPLVVKTEADLTLTCLKDNVSDSLLFDSEKAFLGVGIRKLTYNYENKEEYERIKKTINEGNLKIENNEGSAIFDDNALQITLIIGLNNTNLSEEYGQGFPINYYVIKSYYTRTKEYSCSI